ncbi:hypothetical protein EDB89DRAFT_1957207 [Lactarius sanguifluus]|nr:hypothetical protein EDB89DRAFT_1957207 [Lactarius sanguifluus]
MIIPPGRMLDNFSTLNVSSIWDDDAGKKFLTRRLGDGANADGGVGPGFHPRSDSGRLQNIARFLSDIKSSLRDMNARWWTSDNAESIRRERRSLLETRRAEVYRTGHGTFDQERNRESPAFVPAAQQDLIVLTLEILARDPVASVATPRNDAFREAYKQFKKVALTQALIRAQALMRAQTQAPPQSQADYETRARIRAQAADSSDMVKRALGPVLQSLGLEAAEMPPPQGDTSPPHILVETVPDTDATTDRPDDAPVPEHAAPAQKSPPPGQVEAIPSLPYSMASSSAFGQADAVESGDSPV